MKQEYTQYPFLIKWIYKKKKQQRPELRGDDFDSIDEFWDMFLPAIIKNAKEKPLSDSENNEMNVLQKEYDYLKLKKGNQYFITDNNLVQFLINSYKENIQLDLIIENLPAGSFIINFPLSAKVPSLFISTLRYAEEGVLIIRTGNKYAATFKTIDFNIVIQKSKEMGYVIKLILGLCLYLKCFPHALRDGLPDDCSHPSHYNGNKITVITANEIIDSSDRTVIPHIRSGHFRLLSAERYKEMRHQVIFVHECFVKGKAKTVEDINERKQLQEAV